MVVLIVLVVLTWGKAHDQCGPEWPTLYPERYCDVAR